MEELAGDLPLVAVSRDTKPVAGDMISFHTRIDRVKSLRGSAFGKVNGGDFYDGGVLGVCLGGPSNQGYHSQKARIMTIAPSSEGNPAMTCAWATAGRGYLVQYSGIRLSRNSPP